MARWTISTIKRNPEIFLNIQSKPLTNNITNLANIVQENRTNNMILNYCIIDLFTKLEFTQSTFSHMELQRK